MTREYAKWVSKATYDTHPDWSGAWAMVGGTVFDRATQTSEGGATSKGVRSHPPYNAEWEAIQLIVEDEKGAKVEWSLEWGAPNQLGRQGIRPSTFPPERR